MSEPTTKPHPRQPVVFDEHGIARFRANKLINMLLMTSKLDLNDLLVMDTNGQFGEGDYVQLMQLIGYSVYGAADLDFMPRELLGAANTEIMGLLFDNEAGTANQAVERSRREDLHISGAWTAAGCGRAIVRGKVLADRGVDLRSVPITLNTPDGRGMASAIGYDGSFEFLFDGEGPATLQVLVPEMICPPWKEIPVHLIRGGVSLPVIDLRTCTNASCEDVPAMRMLVPTAEVRVFYQNRRILQVSRRCAMRALKTGEGLSGYWRPTRFETREGRTLAASDIDWTGFGLKPIIHHSRVLVQRSDVLLRWANLGPLERARVLDVFRRDGVLPEGYHFSPGYPDLRPNDVNWEVK